MENLTELLCVDSHHLWDFYNGRSAMEHQIAVAGRIVNSRMSRLG